MEEKREQLKELLTQTIDELPEEDLQKLAGGAGSLFQEKYVCSACGREFSTQMNLTLHQFIAGVEH